MAKRRRKNRDPWITIVSILTIIGLLTLGAFGVYHAVQKYRAYSTHSRENMPDKTVKKSRRRSYALSNPHRLSPDPINSGVLYRKTKVPLEIVRNQPARLRPAGRREYLANRVSRLETSIGLLKEAQKQEQALAEMQKRIKALHMMDAIYDGGITQ